MEYVPPMKPRLYSIASANKLVKDKIELCIILDDWKNSKG